MEHSHGGTEGPGPSSRPASATAAAMRARREAAQARAAALEGLRRWEVQRGDDPRSIAVQVLAETWGRPPTPPEVEAYRRTIVELNRDRLADPGRPDRLTKGQILVLPRVPRPGPA